MRFGTPVLFFLLNNTQYIFQCNRNAVKLLIFSLFLSLQIMEKIDEERSLSTASKKSRKPKLPSVNKELAAKLLALMEEVKNVDRKIKKKVFLKPILFHFFLEISASDTCVAQC